MYSDPSSYSCTHSIVSAPDQVQVVPQVGVLPGDCFDAAEGVRAPSIDKQIMHRSEEGGAMDNYILPSGVADLVGVVAYALNPAVLSSF